MNGLARLTAVAMAGALAMGTMVTCGTTHAQDNAQNHAEPNAAANAQRLGEPLRERNWRRAGEFQFLKLRDGRVAYHGERLLRNAPPFLRVANDAEGQRGIAYELMSVSAPAIFEAISSAEMAGELVRLFVPGHIVESVAQYQAMARAAREAAQIPAPEGFQCWEWQVNTETPAFAGLTVRESDAGGWAVDALIFTDADGTARYDVLMVRATISASGVLSIRREPAISGPPAHWQTAGEVNVDEQRWMRRQVIAYRDALREARPAPTLDALREAVRAGDSFVVIAAKFGEPADDIGSGIHIYVYRLADGTAVIFGVVDHDEPPMYARHVRFADRPNGGLGRIGDLLEDLHANGD